MIEPYNATIPKLGTTDSAQTCAALIMVTDPTAKAVTWYDGEQSTCYGRSDATGLWKQDSTSWKSCMLGMYPQITLSNFFQCFTTNVPYYCV